MIILYWNIRLFLTIHFYRLWSFCIRKPSHQKQIKNILYLPAFFEQNAGYNWRVSKWKEQLLDKGYSVDIQPATTSSEFYLRTENSSKFLIKYLKRRFKQVRTASKYDCVIVRRELLIYNDYGDLFLDKLLLKLNNNVILDFDDDIAAAKNQPKQINNLFGKLLLEHGNKFNETLTLYSKFMVASNYLKNKVLTENNKVKEENIQVIPTCVDYDKYDPKIYPSQLTNAKFTLGWIGGDHNYHELRRIIPQLNKAYKNNFQLLVIGGDKFSDKNAVFPIIFKKWSLSSEIKDLYDIDIGLMPLKETAITKGKGAFKLIQYMGLGIIGLVSPVTINREIIDDGVNGFLVENDDWNTAITQTLEAKNNFQKIGSNARKTIFNKYSYNANFKTYMALIDKPL